MGIGGAYDAISELIRERGIIRPRDVERIGYSRTWLRIFANLGFIRTVGPRVFSSPDYPQPPLVAIAVACAPRSIACLTSALWAHGLFEGEPPRVWLALHRKARLPKLVPSSVRFVRMSSPALSAGVEQVRRAGYEFNVYSVAKTVADCFRFRKLVPYHYAAALLERVTQEQICSLEEVMHFARVCRVSQLLAKSRSRRYP